MIDVYLAAPYTCRSRFAIIRWWVHRRRFRAAAHCAAWLAKKGLIVYAPTVHSHPMAAVMAMPTDWGFWKRFDEAYMRHCRQMYILNIPGWRESIGVTEEREIMSRRPQWLITRVGDGYKKELLPTKEEK